MIGRTMSYLSLTVVAAAAFLVSGCVPIEQVSPAESERISRLEQLVTEAVGKSDEAVAAVKPAEFAKRVSQAVEDNNDLRNDLRKLITAVDPTEFADHISQAVEDNKDLRDGIINSLCDNATVLRLVDVQKSFADAVNGHPDLIKNGLAPKLQGPANQGTYEYTYKDLSRKELVIVKDAIQKIATHNNNKQVVLDVKDRWQRCGPLEKQEGALVYVSVSGIPSGEAERDYALSIQLEFVNPFKGSVWFVPQTDHWLSRSGVAPYIRNQKKRIKILQIFGDTDGIEITGPGSAGGKWNRNRDRWTWEVNATLRFPPKSSLTPESFIKLTENLHTSNTAVYAMVARKVPHKVREQTEIFRVVQYRIFKVDSPEGTFKDQLVKLNDALKQPACPPPSGIQHKNAEDAFRSVLEDFYPNKPCKED